VRPRPEQVRSWVESRFTYKVRRSAKRGEIYLIDSPFVPGDSGFHVGVSIDEAWVRDFRPQYENLHRKSFLGFVADVEGISYTDAVKLIMGDDAKAMLAAAKRDLLRDKEEPEEEIVRTNALPPGLTRLADVEAKEKHPKTWQLAMGYLNSRGITADEAYKYNVLYDPTSIVFCYYEYGQEVYWQRRHFINKIFEFPPTLNEFLWGFDDIEPRGILYLVESIFNASSIGPGAGATGGATLKERQLRLIRMLQPSKIVLAPDNDDAGIASLRKEYYQLDPYFKDRLFYCLPPKDKDWNDLAKEMNRLQNKNVVRDWLDKNTKPLTKLAMIKLTMN
jgi:hypothetical protein